MALEESVQAAADEVKQAIASESAEVKQAIAALQAKIDDLTAQVNAGAHPEEVVAMLAELKTQVASIYSP